MFYLLSLYVLMDYTSYLLVGEQMVKILHHAVAQHEHGMILWVLVYYTCVWAIDGLA